MMELTVSSFFSSLPHTLRSTRSSFLPEAVSSGSLPMSTSPRACVEIEDVTKRFGPVTAVDRASLAIGDGEFF
jgi:hypothetical protein